MSTPPKNNGARIVVRHGTQTGTYLGGSLGTAAFTDEIIHRLSNKLEVWSSLS